MKRTKIFFGISLTTVFMVVILLIIFTLIYLVSKVNNIQTERSAISLASGTASVSTLDGKTTPAVIKQGMWTQLATPLYQKFTYYFSDNDKKYNTAEINLVMKPTANAEMYLRFLTKNGEFSEAKYYSAYHRNTNGSINNSRIANGTSIGIFHDADTNDIWADGSFGNYQIKLFALKSTIAEKNATINFFYQKPSTDYWLVDISSTVDMFTPVTGFVLWLNTGTFVAGSFLNIKFMDPDQ